MWKATIKSRETDQSTQAKLDPEDTHAAFLSLSGVGIQGLPH